MPRSSELPNFRTPEPPKVGGGAFNKGTTKVLHFTMNPASQVAKRKEEAAADELSALRSEGAEMKARLEELEEELQQHQQQQQQGEEEEEEGEGNENSASGNAGGGGRYKTKSAAPSSPSPSPLSVSARLSFSVIIGPRLRYPYRLHRLLFAFFTIACYPRRLVFAIARLVEHSSHNLLTTTW